MTRLQFALKHARQGTVELGVESAMALLTRVACFASVRDLRAPLALVPRVGYPSTTWEIAENSTPIRGVRFDKHSGKWLAQIKIKGKAFNLGRYQTREEALTETR